MEEVLRIAGAVLDAEGAEALRDYALEVYAGDIVYVQGDPGSGVRTLVRLLAGDCALQSGKLILDGEVVSVPGRMPLWRHGLYAVAAEKDLVEGLTVAENLEAMLDIKTPTVKQLVRNLSGGNQQKVVVAKVLAAQNDILIFDEPTRGIDVGAKQEIYKLMNELVESGKSILMISSEMEEMLGMSDRIIVLHEGRVSGEILKQDFSQERVLELASGFVEGA